MNQKNQRISNFLLQELRDILILIGISIGATFMFTGAVLFVKFSLHIRSILYGFLIGYTIWKGNQIIGWLLDKKYPWHVKPVFSLFVHLSSSIVFTIVDIVVVNYLLYKYLFKVDLLSDLLHFFYYAVVQFGIAMLVTTIFYVKHYFDSWRRLFVSQEEYKREALALQYETLKSYVNPHFLFNSLSVLSSLVERDTVKSQQFIKQLSDIYRYVLEQKDKELVPLETELDFIASYINLHRIRHGESLRVDVNIDDKSGCIIPLSMQILLENVFKHNIISYDEPLDVKIRREGEFIVVRNKIQTRKTINEPGGLGLETICKRYEFFTKQQMVIKNDDGYFTVKLPVIVVNLNDNKNLL